METALGVEQGKPDGKRLDREITASGACVVASKADAAELDRRNKLQAPFFDAFRLGCQIPEEGFLRFLASRYWDDADLPGSVEIDVDLPADMVGKPRHDPGPSEPCR
jgi:hypothetical protein